ncbi:MAG: hypothetical protein U5K29_00495 [Acidimicrobiales bacterium]|nr:hypothetical protein [Acidimicrobiales bacterium]
MLNDRILACLRRTAALLHCIPDSVLVISADGRAVLRAGPDAPGATTAAMRTSTCGFRSAVARAWSLHRDRHRLSFLHLSGNEHLHLRFVTGLAADPEPDGVFRIRFGAEQIALFATTLELDTVRELTGPHTPVEFHEDRALGITIGHIHDATDTFARRALGDLAACCVVEELVADLNPLTVDHF